MRGAARPIHGAIALRRNACQVSNAGSLSGRDRDGSFAAAKDA
jgi:hypothetical protein